MTTAPLHLAVALDGTGWHPASWRTPGARPTDLFTAGYWTDLVTEAERGLLDFVTIEDSLGMQPASGPGPGGVQGRLDAVLIAARVAPLTQHIGLVPTIVATHTEPFHASKSIATLDYVSSGRAGVRIQISARTGDAAHFGRRAFPDLDLTDRRNPAVAPLVGALIEEAADYVEVLRRLWDSWEDDAEIRDVATGRFVDRDKLHYIDFEGATFSVRGPSITPRPPQGQPVVSALGHGSVPYSLIARSTDIGYVTPRSTEDAQAIVAEIRAGQDAAGRAAGDVHIFGDLVVFLDDTASAAADRKARLDDLAGAEYAGDAQVFTGTPADLADLLRRWQRAGLTGYRLRPGALPHDLEAITRGLVPQLQSRGAFRRSYTENTLRGLLGFARPASCYAKVS